MFVSHAGKNYPVCCPGCAARFQQNPQQFLDS
jgi:YHS domain-containing protein